MSCDGESVDTFPEFTTYDPATAFFVVTDMTKSGRKSGKIYASKVFSGWNSGNMVIQNNSPGDDISFIATNSSAVLSSPARIEPNNKSLTVTGFLRFSKQLLVISSNTIEATRSFHRVDTEGAAASDQIDTINGGVNGYVLFLMQEDPARTVTLKNGTGNLDIGADIVLNSLSKVAMLFFQDSFWRKII